MDTSRTISALSNPQKDERIPDGVIEYINTRNRMRLFSVVQEEFVRSGISQKDLARRLGKDQGLVCRLLGAPGNWTADTASGFLFAMSGAVLNYSLTYPLKQPPRNLHCPEWLTTGTSGTLKITDGGWSAKAAATVSPSGSGRGQTATVLLPD